MPSQVTNYQCPTCTGPLHFSSETGRLECDYCGASFDTAEIEKLYKDKDAAAAGAKEAADEKAARAAKAGEAWDTSGLDSEWGSDAAGMREYNCPSCGAQLICDETTAATSCPYCGNPTIVPGQFGGTLRPDFVLPFKMDKEAAVAALKNHYKGKLFLPGSFKANNHIEEIRGIYVPFWLFDGSADADVNFKASRSYKHREGDYEVTTTEHYDVFRSGSLSFERIPVDASTKMPDNHMDSIEPYDYGELKDFSTAYLPGYMADKYDVSAQQSAERADLRAEESIVGCLRDTVLGYDSCLESGRDVRLHRGKVRYALLPVWMLNTKWEGKDYLFAMNGQTGKLVGDLPVSKAKFWGTFGGIFAPLAALAAYLYFFVW